MKITKFNDEVIKELGYYVYKLIDPRNGNVFYVGKGQGNRIFDHVNGILPKEDLEEWQDDESEKIQTIREIRGEGLEVIHLIHRHHLDRDTALEVEAALIDAYSGLTNVVSGINSDYGVASVEQIVSRYGLEKIDKFDEEDKVLLIKIRQESVNTWGNGSVYETVCKWWKLNKKHVYEVKQIAAVIDGVVKNVYEVEDRIYNEELNRWGFVGTEIKNSPYINKRIPDEYKKRGSANPAQYTFKI